MLRVTTRLLSFAAVLGFAVLGGCLEANRVVGTDPTRRVIDDFERPRGWTTRILGGRGTAADSARLERTNGNPDGYRHMRHELADSSSIVVMHRYDLSGYHPGAVGAIASLDYSEDRRVVNPAFPGAAVGAAFVIEQDGQVYRMLTGTFSNTSWQTWAKDNIRPTDFTPSPGPDFSRQGGLMRFGYLRSNTNAGSGQWLSTHGIDNFTVIIVPAP